MAIIYKKPIKAQAGMSTADINSKDILKTMDVTSDPYHTDKNGIINVGPYSGMTIKEATEFRHYQNLDAIKAKRNKQALIGANSANSAINKFANDYVTPATKAALAFNPIAGPIIGLSDATQAWNNGERGAAIVGAGMEALPFVGKYIGKGVGYTAKLIDKTKAGKKVLTGVSKISKYVGNKADNVLDMIANNSFKANTGTKSVINNKLLYKLTDAQKSSGMLNDARDIYDIRKDYHSGLIILSPEDRAMLNYFGHGDVDPYLKHANNTLVHAYENENAIVKEVTIEDATYSRTAPQAQKVKVEPKNLDVPDQVKINAYNAVLPNMPSQINIKTYGMDVINKKHRLQLAMANPFERRTALSRTVDNEVRNWYTNPIIQDRYINYGGSMDNYNKMLNNLSIPTRVDTMMPRKLSGYYSPYTGASYTRRGAPRSTMWHEAAHKSRLVPNSGTEHALLPELYKDLYNSTDINPGEAYSDIMKIRGDNFISPEKQFTKDEIKKFIKNTSAYYLGQAKITNWDLFTKVFNNAPALLPAALGLNQLNKE